MRARNGVGIAVVLAAIVIIALIWIMPVNSSNKVVEAMKQPQAFSDELEATTDEYAEPTTNYSHDISFSNSDEAREYIKSYSEEKGYDFSVYPDKLFDLVVKDPESISYVLDYPREINEEHSATLEINNFNQIPLLIQWDKRWGYHQFKNGVVGLDGCGATCLSMVAVYLNKDASLTPDVIADYAANAGYFVNGSGTSWDLFSKGIKQYGLKSKSIGTSKSELVSAIEENHPVIVSVRKGDFTKKGHYIVIAGYEDDEFVVNDPFSITNSNKRWSWDRIQPQIKNMWEFYK